jgi:thymidine phosphorylase
MAQKMKKIASKLGIRADVVITFGDEPIGNGIGPHLEARDVLKVLRNIEDAPSDLKEKAVRIAGNLIDVFGKDLYGTDHRSGDGMVIAEESLISGKAFSQFEKIVRAQGGVDELEPAHFRGSDISSMLEAPSTGQITDIDNRVVAKTARLAGAPSNKECGMDIFVRTGDIVNKGDALMMVHAGSEDRLKLALEHLRHNSILSIDRSS